MGYTSNEYIGTLGVHYVPDPVNGGQVLTYESDRLSEAVVTRMDSWYHSVETNGIINQWNQNFCQYYGSPGFTSYGNTGGFGSSGEGEQYMTIRVNHYRNVLTHMLNMLYAKQRALKSAASNTDPEALNSTSLFDNILEHTMRIKHGSRFFKDTGEIGMITGTGAGFVEWDTFKGAPYATGDNKIIHSGDLRMRAKTPMDFYTDLGKQEWEDVDWVIVRDYVNKYILAVNFPDYADQILKLKRNNIITGSSYFEQYVDSDDVPVYKFFHKRTPGLLPDGRYAIVLDKNLVPYDGPNPYGELPLFLIRPSKFIGSFYGYTIATDLAPIQMFYDLVASMVCTNVTAYGLPPIVGRAASDIQATELVGGMKYLQIPMNAELPQALNLMSNNGEMMNLLNAIEGWMESISGVNSVVRGNPESSLKSGVALSIIQSQAIQFMSGFDASISDFEEDVGNFILKLYKKFADTEQVVSIIGRDQMSEIRRWDKSDIALVENVYVERVDPVSQTIAGRMQIAQDLLHAQKLGTPQEYITVLQTGQWTPVVKSEESQNKLVRVENQRLLDGIVPMPTKYDDHDFHISEHMTVVADPDTRLNPQVMQAVDFHIQQHEMLKQQNIIEQAQKQMAVQAAIAPPQMPGLPPGAPPPPMGPQEQGPPPPPMGMQ